MPESLAPASSGQPPSTSSDAAENDPLSHLPSPDPTNLDALPPEFTALFNADFQGRTLDRSLAHESDAAATSTLHDQLMALFGSSSDGTQLASSHGTVDLFGDVDPGQETDNELEEEVGEQSPLSATVEAQSGLLVTSNPIPAADLAYAQIIAGATCLDVHGPSVVLGRSPLRASSHVSSGLVDFGTSTGVSRHHATIDLQSQPPCVRVLGKHGLRLNGRLCSSSEVAALEYGSVTTIQILNQCIELHVPLDPQAPGLQHTKLEDSTLNLMMNPESHSEEKKAESLALSPDAARQLFLAATNVGAGAPTRKRKGSPGSEHSIHLNSGGSDDSDDGGLDASETARQLLDAAASAATAAVTQSPDPNALPSAVQTAGSSASVEPVERRMSTLGLEKVGLTHTSSSHVGTGGAQTETDLFQIFPATSISPTPVPTPSPAETANQQSHAVHEPQAESDSKTQSVDPTSTDACQTPGQGEAGNQAPSASTNSASAASRDDVECPSPPPAIPEPPPVSEMPQSLPSDRLPLSKEVDADAAAPAPSVTESPPAASVSAVPEPPSASYAPVVPEPPPAPPEANSIPSPPTVQEVTSPVLPQTLSSHDPSHSVTYAPVSHSDDEKPREKSPSSTASIVTDITKVSSPKTSPTAPVSNRAARSDTNTSESKPTPPPPPPSGSNPAALAYYHAIHGSASSTASPNPTPTTPNPYNPATLGYPPGFPPLGMPGVLPGMLPSLYSGAASPFMSPFTTGYPAMSPFGMVPPMFSYPPPPTLLSTTTSQTPDRTSRRSPASRTSPTASKGTTQSPSTPSSYSGPPVRIVVGAAPPEADPAASLPGPIESLLDGPPIVHHDGALYLHPDVFGSLSSSEVKGLEKAGIQEALQRLQSTLVVFLRARLKARRAAGPSTPGTPHSRSRSSKRHARAGADGSPAPSPAASRPSSPIRRAAGSGRTSSPIRSTSLRPSKPVPSATAHPPAIGSPLASNSAPAPSAPPADTPQNIVDTTAQETSGSEGVELADPLALDFGQYDNLAFPDPPALDV